MRIQAIYATDVLPIRRFTAADLSDVVVLAGPNGVGKSRLTEAIVRHFREPRNPSSIRLLVDATCDGESSRWGKATLDTSDREDAQRLIFGLQVARRRSNWTSSILQFESDRSIQQIQPYTFSWDVSDPFEEQPGWDTTFSGFRSRFQDTLHSLFRKVRSHREMIARTALDLRAKGETAMPLEWNDPLGQFKAAFSQLVAPKVLLDPDPQRQQIEYEVNGQRFPIAALSSGEREVVNIVFDFLLRAPEDCVVFFDEPELHLHPELSYRLLQTLRTIGARNQFVFCTHSPEIITASLDHSVFFIAPPKDDPSQNQAVPIHPEEETSQALQLLGQSIGIIALGKRIVLIEGVEASLDKQTYGAILRNQYPNLVLVPCGGKGTVVSFDRLLHSVLERSIWGVQFFMLCDGDTTPHSVVPTELEQRSRGRFRRLSRYHLENYFLDEDVLAAVFRQMEPRESWLCDPQQIHQRLLEIARGFSNMATALIVSAQLRSAVGQVHVMPAGVHECDLDELVLRFQKDGGSERARMTECLGADAIESVVRTTSAQVSACFSSDAEWKRVIPGRPVFNTLAAKAKLAPGRLKHMYLAEAARDRFGAFAEINEVFASFDSMAPGA